MKMRMSFDKLASVLLDNFSNATLYKLAYSTDTDDWLDKFVGSSLLQQAIDLSKAEIENDLAREQHSAAGNKYWEVATQLRNQKKMLDLQRIQEEVADDIGQEESPENFQEEPYQAAMQGGEELKSASVIDFVKNNPIATGAAAGTLLGAGHGLLSSKREGESRLGKVLKGTLVGAGLGSVGGVGAKYIPKLINNSESGPAADKTASKKKKIVKTAETAAEPPSTLSSVANFMDNTITGKALLGALVGAGYGATTRKLPNESRLRRIGTSALAGLISNPLAREMTPKLNERLGKHLSINYTPNLVMAGAIKGVLSPVDKDNGGSRAKNTAKGMFKGIKFGLPIDLLGSTVNTLHARAFRDLQRDERYLSNTNIEDSAKIREIISKLQEKYKNTPYHVNDIVNVAGLSARTKFPNFRPDIFEKEWPRAERSMLFDSLKGAGMGALYGGVTEKLPGESRLRRMLTSAAAGGVGGVTANIVGPSHPGLASTSLYAAGTTKGLLDPIDKDDPKKLPGFVQRISNSGTSALQGSLYGALLDSQRPLTTPELKNLETLIGHLDVQYARNKHIINKLKAHL